MRRLTALLLCFCFFCSLAPSLSEAAWGGSAATRIKDVAKIQGVRNNQLVGYGLVVGLAGTGDSDKISQTIQSIKNMLMGFGVMPSTTQMKPKNVAAVMVTATLPAFSKSGDTIDATISSMGDAKSLQGGVLLQTPLKAANGQVYAAAQGPVSTGGFVAGGGGASQQKNFPTVGMTPNGAIVEKEVAFNLGGNGTLTLSLAQPDFTTASRIVEALDGRFGAISRARDAGSIQIQVPAYYEQDLVSFIAAVEELPIVPDAIAKVVINERTGTVVMGSNITVDEVAVAQGGLSIKITKSAGVSQPGPFSGGSTVVVPNTNVDVKEENRNMLLLPAASSVGDVVNALNSVGATPRDVISILQAMKAAGALHADLQII